MKGTPFILSAVLAVSALILCGCGLIAGPPKRFAQAVGLLLSTTALALHFFVGNAAAATGVLAVLGVFAALEAFLGFCAGCFVFGYLMRWGLIPQSVCEECVIAPEFVAS